MPREGKMNTQIMHQPSFQRFFNYLIISLAVLAAVACGGSKSMFTQSGEGSYYADKFDGRRTASGEPYRPGQLTAAHNTLPFGTKLKVTNTRNGHSVNVVVNDRGPHARGRIVDVSKKAARKLDIIDAGVAPMKIKVLHMGAAPRK